MRLRTILILAILVPTMAWASGHRRHPRRHARAPVARPVAAALEANAATPAAAAARPRIRASYLYDYMPAAHLDSLAAVGMNRAVIKWIGDSLNTRGAAELKSFMARGARYGIEIAPSF